MSTLPDNALAPDNESQLLLRYLRDQQNLPVALVCGFIASLLGAVVWAAVTVMTGYQIGWIAVGVGFIVGYAVRLGHGFETKYGIIGASLAFFGCLLGHLFTVIGMISQEEKMGIWSVALSLDYTKIPEILVATASPMDILFYAIAIYEGFRFSVTPLTEDDLRLARKAIGSPVPAAPAA